MGVHNIDVMRTKILLGLLGLSLVSAVIVRETLILKEIDAVQEELKADLQKTIESVDTLNRLNTVTSSDFVYDRYYEPVILSAQRLFWSPTRTRISLDWKSWLNRNLEDGTYKQRKAIVEQTEMRLESTKMLSKPGIGRLVDLARISQDLGTRESRIKVIEAELDEIQKASAADDQKVLLEIKEKGKAKLHDLRAAINGMEDAALVDFLSSPAYFNQIQSEVVERIMDLKQRNLRIATYKEFMAGLQKRLSHQAVKLQELRKQKPDLLSKFDGPQDDQSLAELLKMEYEKERQRELSMIRNSKLSNPSNSETERPLP